MHLLHSTLLSLVTLIPSALCQDNLGLNNGYIDLKTTNFNARIVRDSQTLASLTAAGNSFDFLPFDYLSRRARNGQYHWGDVTLRYREAGSTPWNNVDSAAARRAVAPVQSSGLASSLLTNTIPANTPLNLTRTWTNINGDLGLEISVTNTGGRAIELGSFGFPAEFNSIFTDRSAEQIQARCSLSDPYIGMHAGYLQVTPVSGNGPALVVTPVGDTPFEAYRNLGEGSFQGTYYGSQTFEGYYEWQVLSKAWAEQEWKGKQPWNVPSSRTINPGQTTKFGLRFSVASGGIKDIETAVKRTSTLFAVGVPGYILPRDLSGRLLVSSGSAVRGVSVEPAGALTVAQQSSGVYGVTPSSSAWGRARITVNYADGKVQTVHYYITKAAPEALRNLGQFSTNQQWFSDTSDPFGRAPSVITYDYETKKQVLQDDRAWVAGLSDEAGAGSFLAAAMKQAARPNAAEVAKLEDFVNKVVWGRLQVPDYGVRKSLFFFEPSQVPGYAYSSDINWSGWASWNKAQAYDLGRAYNYVHVAATYWAMYRTGRAYPALLKQQNWQWYLRQAYQTVARCVQVDGNGRPTVGYSRVGLMGETVFGEILRDLKREGYTTEANNLEASMRSRATQWDNEAVPFGSEMAWDSTGQEGVYYWTKYFGLSGTANKALGTVLAYQPTVAHWGWNGNARRYWDNIYGGKLRRIERQIHHYGSGLNALVLLSAFRSSPTDSYLLRAGYGGMNGPLSNINAEGFAAASFHSWPDTLKWDGISGDYGPNFVGLVLGSATYVAQDRDAGLVAYGGTLATEGATVKVQPRDAVRRKVFIGPLGVEISTDAGEVKELRYNTSTREIEVVLGQQDGGPIAGSTALWVERTAGSGTYRVTTAGVSAARGGWTVALPASGTSTVKLAVG